MRIPSPEQALQATIARLPRWLGDLIWNVTYAIAWITLSVWFLSAIADLQIVISWGRWLSERAASLWGAVQPFLEVVASVVRVWRAWLAPAREWLETVFNVSIPRELTELLIAIIPALPAIVRFVLTRLALHRNTQRKIDPARYLEDGTTDVLGPWFIRGLNLTIKTNQAALLATWTAALVALAITLALVEFVYR